MSNHPMPTRTLRSLRTILEVEPAAWDRIADPDDPFTTYTFLSALERSRSVGPGTGWRPCHLIIEDGGLLIAAAPLYVKSDSYGEYIFDFAWADASQRSGIPYYPKLVCAVPFTPATGARLLVDPVFDVAALQETLISGMRQLADALKCWSIHLLFVRPEVRERLAHTGLLGRSTHQLRWFNQDETGAPYTGFAHWLQRFRSKNRKEVLRERRRAGELGCTVSMLRGTMFEPRHWTAIEAFYRETVDKKWGRAYLSPAFFREAPNTIAPLTIGFFAEKDGELVAGSLCFQRGGSLFGRWWGCVPGFEALHFELCYHAPIEECIRMGWTRFEAGAQGEHKLKRGLMPETVHSLHWLRHPKLAMAVTEALVKEGEHNDAIMAALYAAGPFHRPHLSTESPISDAQNPCPDEVGQAQAPAPEE